MRSGSRPAVRTPTPASAGRDLTRLKPLGIGLGYQAQLRDYIRSRRDRFDFLEVVPDILWTDLGRGARPRYRDIAEDVAFIGEVARAMPVIPHSIGLSIGSAHRYESEHVEQMARWFDRLHFPWHSDHLAFHLTEGSPQEHQPQPHRAGHLRSPDARDLVSRRILDRTAPHRRAVPDREQRLLHFESPDQRRSTEPELPQRADGARRDAGCCSTCTISIPTRATWASIRSAFLDRLDLDRVVEIHVAGGLEFDGFYLDAHSGASPEPVWTLLEEVLPRCPNLCGVVFELFGSWFDELGTEGLDRQLGRMRDLWARHRGQALAA